MTPLILPLGRHPADLADAGGKGANLAALVRAGFPVPDGFIDSTAAYRLFVEINDLQTEIIDRSFAIAAGDMAAFERASTAIRERFAEGSMPAEVAQAILDDPAASPLAEFMAETAGRILRDEGEVGAVHRMPVFSSREAAAFSIGLVSPAVREPGPWATPDAASAR